MQNSRTTVLNANATYGVYKGNLTSRTILVRWKCSPDSCHEICLYIWRESFYKIKGAVSSDV